MYSNGKIPKQHGSALIVSLIILLLMTILGVTSMQTTTMQDRMAGNMKDRNTAFQRAELALREAQRGIPGSVDTAISGSVTDAENWISHFENEGIFNSDDRYSAHVQEMPYTVQEECEEGQVCNEGFGPLRNRMLYRITALGLGASDDTRVVLQATVSQAN